MLNFEHLLNMQLGSGIIAAANSKDERYAIVKFFGSPKPDDAKWILNNIKLLRLDLQKDGFCLPTCIINDGNNLKYNELIIQYGIELYKCTIDDLSEIISFLRNESYKYFQNISTKNYLIDFSLEAFDDIKNNKYQESYEKNKLIYFYSHPQSSFYNHLNKCDILQIRSLNEIAGIKIKNNMVDDAIVYLKQATKLSSVSNIVDISLRMQVNLNYAMLLLGNGHIEEAYNCFVTLFDLSQSSQYFLYYVYANMGMAQCCERVGNLSRALDYLKNIKNILSPNDSNTRNLYTILGDEIILIHERIKERNENQIINLENQIQQIRNQRSQLFLKFTTSVLKFATSIILRGLPMNFIFGDLNSIENSTINNSGGFFAIGRNS